MSHFGQYWKASFIAQGVWAVVAGIFVFARLMTRYYIIGGSDTLGYDDWILLTAWIVNVIMAVVTMASFYPLFQGWSILGYYMSQEFTLFSRVEMVFGVGLALGWVQEGLVRAAVVSFLYRLAVRPWHRYVLLIVGIPTVLFAFGLAPEFIYYFAKYAREPFELPPSVTSTLITATIPFPMQHALMTPTLAFNSLTIPVDLFFAFFPWVMLRHVNMKPKKKYLICGSLSLTALGAGCAIYKVYLLATWAPTQDQMLTLTIMITERGLFYICISVPALLPLWTRYQTRKKNRRWLEEQQQGQENGRAAVLTIGGGDVGIRNKKKRILHGFGGGIGGTDRVINDPRMAALLVPTEPTSRGTRTTGTTHIEKLKEAPLSAEEKDLEAQNLEVEVDVETETETEHREHTTNSAAAMTDGERVIPRISSESSPHRDVKGDQGRLPV